MPISFEHRLLIAGYAAVVLAIAAVTPLRAEDERQHLVRCDGGAMGSGVFVVPPALQAVTEAGGFIVISKHGKPWHPAPSDVRKLGVHIYEGDDRLPFRPLAELSGKPVNGGKVYSHTKCQKLVCRYEAAFVPTSEDAVLSDCGATLPARIVVVGRSERGLAAAQRAIEFDPGRGVRPLSLVELDASP